MKLNVSTECSIWLFQNKSFATDHCSNCSVSEVGQRECIYTDVTQSHTENPLLNFIFIKMEFCVNTGMHTNISPKAFSIPHFVFLTVCTFVCQAQLFSPNTFCHNILSTFTAVYSQSVENRDKFFINFHQSVQVSGKYRRNYQDHTNCLWVIRHQVLGRNMLRLNFCAH